MKTFANLLTALILAGWVSLIAVFSIQNVKNVSLQFLWLRTVEVPLGVVLAFSAGFGMIVGAIAPALLSAGIRRRKFLKTGQEPLEVGEEELSNK